MPGRSVGGSAVEPLLAFSAATNLGLAGRVAHVAAEVPGAERLRVLLRGFGARVAEQASGAQVRFVLDVDDAARRLPPAGGDLVVLVGCGPQPPAAEDVRWLRPGVEATARRDAVIVRDREAAASGAASARLDWARRCMPVSRAAAAELGEAVDGVRIAVSMVLEPKTAVLALLLQEAGAEVAVFAFAAETDDAVAAELRARGVAVHASSAATPEQERTQALALLDAAPQVLIDDGAHVIRLAHAERPRVVAGLLGATEETTSGTTPLRAMAADGALAVPVLSANDALTKTWFDNRHGTGETCVLAIAAALDADLDGTDAVVVGFGPVGEGVVQRLAALGARVVVVERDPRRALAAHFAGFATAPLTAAVASADLVVSATGAPRTLDAAALAACAPDAVVAVAGGAPEEVLPPAGTRHERLGEHLERLHLPGGGAVRLLAGGDCVNIVAGEGNPIDVMDLSFAVQLAAVRALLTGGGGLAPGVHRLADDADAHVAALALGEPEPAGAAGVAPVDWRRTRFETAADA